MSTSTQNIDLQKYRNYAVINTYSVTAPFIFLKDIGFGIDGTLDNEKGLPTQIGPNFNQVRILP